MSEKFLTIINEDLDVCLRLPVSQAEALIKHEGFNATSKKVMNRYKKRGSLVTVRKGKPYWAEHYKSKGVKMIVTKGVYDRMTGAIDERIAAAEMQAKFGNHHTNVAQDILVNHKSPSDV